MAGGEATEGNGGKVTAAAAAAAAAAAVCYDKRGVAIVPWAAGGGNTRGVKRIAIEIRARWCCFEVEGPWRGKGCGG